MDRFERLIVEQIPSLRRYARTLTGHATQSEDLVQDCLARALSRRRLWHAQHEIRPWLFTIMHNVYVNQVRRDVVRSNHQSHVQSISERPTEPADKLLTIRDLETALHGLPHDHREILLLVGVEQLSYQETAKVLDIPIGTVMSRLSRARARLREALRGTASRRRAAVE
ncbi:MAG: sigma-70 family RNA polymerase sigma factor [Gammaproteobacteria bacterium]|nr:sigma-70 family RNA polymerase sigma factor [Gammaproteobacteria bacterium]